MLYIIKSYTNRGYIYKIGYAKDVNKRFQQYYHHNPTCKLISTRDGEIEDETKLHLYLSHKGFRYHKLNEWYLGKDEVLNLFHQDMRKINKYLWKYREDIFKREDFRKFYQDTDSTNKRIYQELFDKYSGNLRIYDKVVPETGETIKSNSKVVDKIYYNKINTTIILEDDLPVEIINFFNQFETLSTFKDSLRFFCEYQFSSDEIRKLVLFRIPVEFQNYYYILGPDRCRALGYQKSKLDNEIEMINNKKSDTILSIISNSFQVSQRYTLKEIKERLGEIYISLGLSKTPKAKDIEEYYEVMKTKVTTSDGVRDGYKLLNIKTP